MKSSKNIETVLIGNDLILIVDDNEEYGKSLQMALGRKYNNVIYTSSEQDARCFLEKHIPCVALLDWRLSPEVTSQQLHADLTQQGVEAIVMTLHSKEIDIKDFGTMIWCYKDQVNHHMLEKLVESAIERRRHIKFAENLEEILNYYRDNNNPEEQKMAELTTKTVWQLLSYKSLKLSLKKYVRGGQILNYLYKIGDHQHKDPIHVNPTENISSYVIYYRKSLLLPNVDKLPKDTNFLRTHEETKSSLTVPVFTSRDQDAIAVFNIESSHLNGYDENDQKRVESVAAILGNYYFEQRERRNAKTIIDAISQAAQDFGVPKRPWQILLDAAVKISDSHFGFVVRGKKLEEAQLYVTNNLDQTDKQEIAGTILKPKSSIRYLYEHPEQEEITGSPRENPHYLRINGTKDIESFYTIKLHDPEKNKPSETIGILNLESKGRDAYPEIVRNEIKTLVSTMIVLEATAERSGNAIATTLNHQEIWHRVKNWAHDMKLLPGNESLIKDRSDKILQMVDKARQAYCKLNLEDRYINEIICEMVNWAKNHRPSNLIYHIDPVINECNDRVSTDIGILKNAIALFVQNACEVNAKNVWLSIDKSDLQSGGIDILIDNDGPRFPESVKPFPEGIVVSNKGTGASLYIIYHSIKAMGGELRLEDKPGDGARIRVSLPISG